MISQGSITADLFLGFLQDKILPNCEPFPGKRSVLILDNASIHKSAAIQRACDEAGVLLQFLPPYSPDYNPIESTFNDLKAWIRLNYSLVAEFSGFDSFLEFAIQQVCTRDVHGHFRTCGYVVHDS